MSDKEIKEAKSLRWLANQFPKVENPKDNGDRLCNCINLYCINAAELIEKLYKENEILQINAANAFQEGLNENQELFENTILDDFAERLKKRFAYNVVIRNTIDNVLDSMKGKNNNEPSSM